MVKTATINDKYSYFIFLLRLFMEDRLYKFAGLVDAGSFTKAAQQLHISQPALTTAVQKLERELHAELLIRGGHTFRLTDAGKEAYQTAKQLKLETSNLRLKLAEATSAKVHLRLGMIDSIADLLFVHGGAFAGLEHKAQLSLTVDNTTRLLQYIERDQLDVALVAKPAGLPKQLRQEPLGKEPLVFVTHTENKQAVQASLKQATVTTFLGYNQNSRTYRLVTNHFKQHGITLQHSFYSTSPEIMLQLVRAKRGSAVLPYMLVQQHINSGELAVIALGRHTVIPRELVSIHREGRNVPALMQELLDQTASQLQQLMSDSSLS